MTGIGTGKSYETFSEIIHTSRLLYHGRIVEIQETVGKSQIPIIGQTLCDSDLNVGDSFLNYRMKQLAFMKKVEFRGELKQMRYYEVRLP